MSKPNPSGPNFTPGTYVGSAAVAGRVNQFIVIGRYGTSAGESYTVQWSAIGDGSDWPVVGSTDARTKQSGEETLPSEYGKVTGISEGDFYGYIFQQNAIHRMEYVGGDVVFAFSTIDRTRGCIDYDRFTQVGDVIYFESEYGRHALVNNQVVDIGRGKTDKTYTPSGDMMGFVARNPAIDCVFFCEVNPPGLGVDGNLLVYNYKTDQWSNASVSSSTIWGIYDVDTEAATIGWLRRNETVSDEYHVQITDSTSGVYLNAQLKTTYKNIFPGGRSMLSQARVDQADANYVSCLSIDDYNPASTEVAVGTLNSRSVAWGFRGDSSPPEGRLQALEVRVTGGASFGPLSGVELEVFFSGDL
jgi:hypothetical protein